MKLSILTENIAGSTFYAEHGLSYLIDIDGESVLFDTGHTDCFLKNARKLGRNIDKEVEKVVLSHGHWDHGNGLQHLNNKALITHPQSFLNRYRKSDHSSIGLALSKNELSKQFFIEESIAPVQLSKNLYFLGQIPRLNGFESQTTSFEFEDGSNDFVPDDSALVAIVNNGIVVITGCAHSGICNTCEFAKKITGIQTIKAVIGGFHLKKDNKQTQETISYFKQNQVETLLPSHCTDLPALVQFYLEFKIKQVKTGMVFNF